ncbi:diamine N-acetyltransferase [Balneicella halophila]|uniref:Diamine N-acetyltransferase n=1 Tax=Balneicella halophila TaxID=1537566 RepID=A0A7L4UQA1_BALHA|nr:GNAT family N-acetyltransferase [Balneicella halophila]PVX51067.1 diamine N-acetyltransferase [Balneicella halophila]
MLLKGKHISLRALEPNDIDLLYALENNTMLWELSNTKAPFSKHILQKYIEISHLDIYETKQLRLVIQTDAGNPIGLIDLFDFDPYHLRAGVGVFIDKKYEGNGYSSKAIQLLKEYALQSLGMHQLYANILATNEKSLALFQKQGFTIAGSKKDWIKTFEGWQDEYLLQCFL